MSEQPDKSNVLVLTSRIATAYLHSHTVPASHLPDLLRSIFNSLYYVEGPVSEPPVPIVPAVSIRRSVSPDSITCLECGRKCRMLKRHLNSEHDLTPDQYRAKWGLPREYPMTAPNYAAARSALAKSLGLGRSTHRRTKSTSNSK